VTAAAQAPAYATLQARFRELGLLRSVIGTLEWDRYAHLAEGSADARGEQLALLECLASDRLAAPDMPELLARAAQEPLAPLHAANLHEMRRDHLHASAVPPALTAAWTRATSACERAWRVARATHDLAPVLPRLHEVVLLTREVASAKAQALGTLPYEALLDRWEPGLRLPALLALVDEWRTALPPIAAVAARAAPQKPLPAVSVDRQRASVPALLERIGFDRQHGLMAESAQPCFSDDTPDDVRITLRYDAQRPLDGLRGGLHETGHSFYERQVPAAWRYQPLGRPRSGGLQESQALLWEVHVGGSLAFRHWLAPQLQAAFGWALTANDLAAAWAGNDLRRDRLDSGEVGYLLHLLLRTELEEKLIDGRLAVADLPEAWLGATQRWLGCAPAADALGCLADIHWYRGLFGYFPSYLIGAAAAAHLMEAAYRALPDLDADLAAGRFLPLRDWLRVHVHEAGSSCAASEIIHLATGQAASGAALVRHLRRRHTPQLAP
jgi:carboxypeptidase Taq